MAPKKPNIAGVKAALDSAVEVGTPKPKPAKGGAAKPAADARRAFHPVDIDPETGLPEDCPIVPLGIDGPTSFYLDEQRQLRALEAKEHGRLPILHLFGTRIDLVHAFWPRLDKDGVPTGSWRPEAAAEQLMAAAARKGVWDPHERVRGAGAWRGADGELILNCGDLIWIGPTRVEMNDAMAAAEKLPVAERDEFLSLARRGRWIQPGAHGRFVYPASAALPRPEVDRKALRGRYDPDKPGAELFKLLRTWNWKRGEVDALLLLGWIAAALIGGALNWRPMVWVTGGAGTGKSTLQYLLDQLFGEAGLIDAADTTAAGIWQLLKHRTVPVGIDELEADADNTKAQGVIKLARLAASGGRMMRGGADHSAVSFTIRSCFLFSSILIPPLLGQDKSRLAILNLNRLAEDAPVPELPADALRALGCALRQRLVDQWHRADETVEIYRAALQDEGYDARGRDQFGALLAAADLVLHTAAPDAESARTLAMKLGAAQLADEATRAVAELAVLAPLLGWQTQGSKPGEIVSIATCIERLLAERRADRSTLLNEEADAMSDAAKFARDTLRRHGVLFLEEEGREWLAIANSHPVLSRVYTGTRWNTPSGSDESVWMQALQRITGAKPSRKTLWFGLAARATLVPVEKAIEPRLDRQDMSAPAGEAGAAPAI